MAVSNQLAKNDQQQITFTQAMQTPGYQKLVNSSLRDPKRVNRFVASVTAAVGANPTLNLCEPATILSAAFQGEALELSPSPTLGEYYLVPYKKKRKDEQGNWTEYYVAQFQIGTAGRIQLAMRTGQYKDLDAIEIRQGEYKGRSPETGKPIFEFETDDTTRENLPIIGYLGYFTLINGFSRSVYFSKEKCLQWADRYSKSFDRKLYDKWKEGKTLDWKEETAVTAPWYAHFDEMSKNLVLRQVLKTAPKSIEMRGLVEGDDKDEQDIASIVAPATNVTPQEATDDFFASSATEEVEGEQSTVKTKATKKSSKGDGQTSLFDGTDNK